MKDKVFFITIIGVLVVSLIIFAGIFISQKIEHSNNEENVVENADNLSNIPIVDKVITEVNKVTDINNLTNPKLEEIAKNTFNEYFKKIASYEKSNIGPMPYLLCELELATQEELDELCKNAESTDDYIKSNVRYKSFKNALYQYVTLDYFEKYFCQFRNVDTFVAFCDVAGEGVACEVKEAELISRVGDTFNFKLTCVDLEMYDHYLNGDKSVKEKDCYYDIEVALDYVDDRLLISKYSNEIILDGQYILEDTDVVYQFDKDGTAEYIINMTEWKGTYVTTGTNEVTITWEQETTWDVMTLEKVVSEVEGTEKVTVINDSKIKIEAEYEGEVIVNEFIKNKLYGE